MDSRDPNLIQEVFNQRAVILTFFGALGGSVRAAVLKTTWREGLRVVFVGGAVAFGVGVLGPLVMSPWIGDVPDEMAGALGTLTAAAFLIGLVAVTLVERFVSGDKIGPNDNGNDDYKKQKRKHHYYEDDENYSNDEANNGPDYGA